VAVNEKLINKDELQDIRSEALKEVAAKTPATTTPKVDTPVTDKTDATPKDGEAKVDVVTVTEDKKPVSFDDISEEEFLRLAEKKGLKIQKETLTPEQQKKQADIEETEKLKFAIENNLITQDGYLEAKAILNSEGADLTKKEFAKAYKEENKNATKEEVESAYDDYYFVQKNIKEKKVKRDEKGKPVLNADEDIEEEETEKPKWDERTVKLGEFRRKNEAERIKANAKAVLDNVDSNYDSFKALKSRADEYVKTANKVMGEIDFSALPVVYKFGEKGKEKEIKAIVKLNEEAKADVQNYINTNLANLMINTDKYKDADEIGNQVRKYIKEKYDNQVGESLYNLGHTSGINEGKVGANAPVTRELVSDDSAIDTVAADIEKRLPENKLFTRGKTK
jgi:hypothetical protein